VEEIPYIQHINTGRMIRVGFMFGLVTFFLHLEDWPSGLNAMLEMVGSKITVGLLHETVILWLMVLHHLFI
jgi:hypothetical protein